MTPSICYQNKEGGGGETAVKQGESIFCCPHLTRDLLRSSSLPTHVNNLTLFIYGRVSHVQREREESLFLSEIEMKKGKKGEFSKKKEKRGGGEKQRNLRVCQIAHTKKWSLSFSLFLCLVVDSFSIRPSKNLFSRSMHLDKIRAEFRYNIGSKILILFEV